MSDRSLDQRSEPDSSSTAPSADEVAAAIGGAASSSAAASSSDAPPVLECVESFDESVEHALITAIAPPIPEATFARVVHLKSKCSVHDHAENPSIPEDSSCNIVIIETTFGVISESSVLRNMLADVEDCTQDIPITVAEPPLRIIINFCEQLSKHHDAVTNFTAGHDTVLVPWQRDFMTPYKDNYPLLESILAGANYLDIQQLLNLTAFTIADLFHGKTVAQLRTIMGITDPGFTAAQIREIEEENAWLRDLDRVDPH